MAKPPLDPKIVRESFDYSNGALYWRHDRARGKIKAGAKAGGLTSRGYERVMLGYHEYPVHHVIFCWHHGYVPTVVDHINGNPLDNQIANLRAASAQTNQYNRKRGRNNKSGCKNVSWSAKKHVWQVHVRHAKQVHSWYVQDFELAELIAHEARNLYHGSFANHV